VTSRRAAALAAALTSSVALASCGDEAITGRPAHRPISVIYVAGDSAGPWAARTQGLADGVKLAIAERDGLIGERAVSIAVVPPQQRDGNQVSAAIGAGRIIRDSRALAVLGVLSAPEVGLSAPQFNGGELALIQYGSGMRGLTEPEVPGEAGRYEPSGPRYALRGVVPDDAVGAKLKTISALHGAQVVAVTTTYQASLKTAAAERAKIAAKLRKDGLEKNAKKGKDDPVPSTSPALTNPSPEASDADRLASRVAESIGGSVVPEADLDRSKPVVVVTDPTEQNPAADAKRILAGVRSAAAVVDAADRAITPSALGRSAGSTTYLVHRTLADDATAAAQTVRSKERAMFGRDRGDAVVAGYRAARRILDLAGKQPDKTIDRVTYAKALVAADPSDPDLPVDAQGDATLGSVELSQLRGGRWVKR
jgi:hypothetical protein